MDESVSERVYEVGSHLLQLGRPNKDAIVKSLRQAATALAQIEQPSFPETSKKQKSLKKLEAAVNPLRKSLVKYGLLTHSDKDVRLLVAICVSEVFRILAPEPPFEDKYMRDIFKLILSIFAELADTTSPYFSKRVKILETVARCKCCVVMLDIDCNDVVLELFNILFSVVREHHQRNLINSVLSIMADILNEEPSQLLVDVVLRNLVKEGKGASSTANDLSISVIQSCSAKLEPFVCRFLTSCCLDRDAVQSELKESYHDIMFKVFKCAPQMLLAVIPNLSQELLTDQVDVRIKAVNLIAKLFALPEHHVAERYHDLFLEFLKRFSDKSAEVRISALQCAKAIYLANPTGKEANELLIALEERLLDFDDKVRAQAVIVACDLAKSNLKFVPRKLISEASERLRDKKISVRKRALQKLLEVYREYCNKCSEGYITISDHFEQIPCKILMLCYDKDCKEFRSQIMELILAEDLFPSLLSIVERTRHWIYVYSLCSPLSLKALNSILSQKRRLQTEMRLYLTMRKEKGRSLEATEADIKRSFVMMSTCFPDPSKAEDSFCYINQMKDNNVFNLLVQILDERAANPQAIRDKFLKLIGDKHPHVEFLRSLSSKCLCNIFSPEHVCCILDQLSMNRLENEHLKASSVELLQAIISIFPSFLRGSEEQVRRLLEQKDPITDKLIKVLSEAGPHISVQFSDFYPFLERVCLEGTRAQSKYAVSAIASLLGSSEPYAFPELCKKLVDSLHSGLNIPTVLQSLGCIAQHSISTFEALDGKITPYIYEKIFQVEQSDALTLCDETSGCSFPGKLKIYGLKTLVKSFLPQQGPQVMSKFADLMNILSRMLEKGEAFDGSISCEGDKAHLRLAAAKSVLRLSRKWDLHISPKDFHSTILIAKDSCTFVRRNFLDKTHKLLKEHAVPPRYACAFAFATSDCLKDLQDDSLKYIKDFIKDYNKKARNHHISTEQRRSITESPAYIVVFLIHALAHDKGFPPEDCEDEEIYAQFCQPFFSVLQELVSVSIADDGMDHVIDTVLILLCIFRAVRRAEDALDATKTDKLHFLADVGILAVKTLSRNGASSTPAPGKIFLPSSMYRISLAKINEEINLKYNTRFSFHQSFIERIIHKIKSQISHVCFQKPNPSLLKLEQRRHQEDGTRSMSSNNKLISVISNQVDVLRNGGIKASKENVRQESTSRRGRKRASPTALESIVLAKKCSTVKEFNDDQSKLEAVLAKQQVSSCDSASLEPSITQAEVSTHKSERFVTCLKDSVRESSSITAEPSSNPSTRFKDPCCSKEIGDNTKAINGQRVKLLSPIDGCFRTDNVEGYNAENRAHKITYDNGDVELVCLDSETWETVRDDSLVERDVLAKDTENFDLQDRELVELFSSNSPEGASHTYENSDVHQPKNLGKKETRKLSSKRINLSVKESRDRSASAIMSTNENAVSRRTRGQKARLNS